MENFNEKKTQFWLSLAHFTNDIYTGMLNPIMPFVAAKIGITMAISTVILSLSHICASLLQPIFGFFSDNLRKRMFIFWGIIFSSIFISFAPAVSRLSLLILFVILGSLGSSFFHPQALGLNMGIFMGLGTLGYSFGPIISSSITQFFGLEKIPLLSLLGIFVGMSMFLFIPKLKPDAFDLKKHEDFFNTFKTIISNRKLNLLYLISVLKSLVSTSTCIFLPFLWQNMGYGAFYIGFALFAYVFAGGIGSFVSRRIEQKIGVRNIFYFSIVSPFPLMLMFLFTYKTYPMIALMSFILMGFLQWLAVPVTMVMAQQIIPQYKSIIGGFINGFSWGIVAIFMTIIGYIAQSKGIMPVLVIISFISAILAYPIVKILFRQIGENPATTK